MAVGPRFRFGGFVAAPVLRHPASKGTREPAVADKLLPSIAGGSGEGVVAVAVLEEDAGRFEGALGEGVAIFIVEGGEAFFGEFGEVDFPGVIGEFFGVEFEGGFFGAVA